MRKSKSMDEAIDIPTSTIDIRPKTILRASATGECAAMMIAVYALFAGLAWLGAVLVSQVSLIIFLSAGWGIPRTVGAWSGSFATPCVTLIGLLVTHGQALSFVSAGIWWADTPSEEWPNDDPEILAEIDSVWDESTGDRRQELVIIGEDLNRDDVWDQLQQCLLTDLEMAVGPASWSPLPDPFALWTESPDELMTAAAETVAQE